MSDEISVGLIEAIGDRLESDFPGYGIIYGFPAGPDFIGAADPSIRVHYAQERGVLSGSQLGGPVRVSPSIIVTLQRPYDGSPASLESQQGSISLASDLRLSVFNLIMDHVTGVASIAAFDGQALWITDYTMTDSVQYLGPESGGNIESITIQFSFEFSRNYGGR